MISRSSAGKTSAVIRPPVSPNVAGNRIISQARRIVPLKWARGSTRVTGDDKVDRSTLITSPSGSSPSGIDRTASGNRRTKLWWSGSRSNPCHGVSCCSSQPASKESAVDLPTFPRFTVHVTSTLETSVVMVPVLHFSSSGNLRERESQYYAKNTKRDRPYARAHWRRPW